MKPLSLLLATDGSAEATAAIDFWRALPLPAGTTLHVICAVESPGSAGDSNSEALEALMAFERAECDAAVTEAVARLGGGGLSVIPHLYEAPAVDAILTTAEREVVDLVTIGAKRRGGLLDLLLGGITVPVTRRSRLPVLVARSLPRGLRSVLVAIDGGRAALRAAHFLARLPLANDTEIIVAHVLSPHDEVAAGHDWDPTLCDDTIAAMRRAESSRLEAHRFRAEMRTGDPAEELLQIIKDTQMDLVLLGARNGSWIENALEPSVSDRLIVDAPCSVLLVP